ncbi:MAG: hypothetical protein H6738_08480 [Alphaproteobacteria bacterium]|nr:hypothetical protein [Alphaproteobacteria bacterium]MCB9696796.1 hypothetical protein [Alphaproteobacteria bacterium]
MRHVTALLLATSLAACTGHGEPIPEQLEASEAVNDRQAEPYEASEAAGLALVSGADRDWTLVLTDGQDAETTVSLHLPGGSDLSSLDARDLDVALGGAWGDDTRAVAVSDEQGLAFVVQPDAEFGPATDAFGADLVAWGEELGRGKMSDDYGSYTVAYRSARFQTDDGAVDALPGEPFEAVFDGVRWRVVVHASFEVLTMPKEMPGCGGGTSSTLSFEMIRVDEATVAMDALAPLPGARMAGQHHCG